MKLKEEQKLKRLKKKKEQEDFTCNRAQSVEPSSSKVCGILLLEIFKNHMQYFGKINHSN